MGTWGYKIDENDTFYDVCELFQNKLAIGENINKIIFDIKECYLDEPDNHIAIISLAKCLWDVDAIDDSIKNDIKSIIENKTDYIYHKNLGADESFLQNRERELNKFFIGLEYHPKKSQVLKKITKTVLLKKGDCFWYKAKGKKYVAIVLEIQGNLPDYLILISKEIAVIPDNILDVLNLEVYTLAWFDIVDMLCKSRIHFLVNISILNSFHNTYGLNISDDGYSLTNSGDSLTWRHEYCNYMFRETTAGDIIKVNRGQFGDGTKPLKSIRESIRERYETTENQSENQSGDG